MNWKCGLSYINDQNKSEALCAIKAYLISVVWKWYTISVTSIVEIRINKLRCVQRAHINRKEQKEKNIYETKRTTNNLPFNILISNNVIDECDNIHLKSPEKMHISYCSVAFVGDFFFCHFSIFFFTRTEYSTHYAMTFCSQWVVNFFPFEVFSFALIRISRKKKFKINWIANNERLY